MIRTLLSLCRIPRLWRLALPLGLCLWLTACASSHVSAPWPEPSTSPPSSTPASKPLTSRPSPPPSAPSPWVQYGVASWYGKPFHGRRTANGERYNMYHITAAHKRAPLGIHAIVTHLQTGRTVHVRINDRGPFIKGRIIDLSYGAAQKLGMVHAGVARVKVEFLPGTVPPKTFVVQAGAYRKRQNAMMVQQALHRHYDTVRVTKKIRKSRPLYQVQLGPFATRAKADDIVRQIRTLGYQGLVLPRS